MPASEIDPPSRFTNAIVCPVLGMHHSGASLLTRALNLLGLELEQGLDSTQTDHHKRFWENELIGTLNMRILRAMDRNFSGYGDYQSLTEIPESSGGINLNAEDEDFIAQYLSEAFPYPLWGWKDARSVLLFPFWLNVLTALGAKDIRPILVIRHPAACVQSMLRAGHILPLASQLQRDPTELIVEMWKAYNQILLAILDETGCFITIHHWLIDDSHARDELERAANYLNIANDGAIQEALTLIEVGPVDADTDREASFVDAEALALYWTLVSRAQKQRSALALT